MRKFFCHLTLTLSTMLLTSDLYASQESLPTRVHDLKYGTVLYEYFQGHAFEALSALNVAKLRGGITGHGEHPTLVEGGLMLAYGMTHEAKLVFESLLENTELNEVVVSLSDRNQAWFYLGKVLLLEQDLKGSFDSLKRVNGIRLKDDKPDLFHEWLYLKGQLAQKISQDSETLSDQIKALPIGSVWQSYLRYNHALLALNNQEHDIAINEFQSLIDDINKHLINQNNEAEIIALKEQCLLSLGQLYLHQNKEPLAIKAFKKIRKDSVFSDQALFAYSVAASNLEEYGLALQALNTLKERPLFTPWLQQVPYALAYLYEQLEEPKLAFEAYRAAAEHYENLAQQLVQDNTKINEQKILQALSLREKSIAQDLMRTDKTPLALGRERVSNDAYGYLQVDPKDFNYATLLSTEPFQLSLRDLHELYKLQFSLSRWEQQLSSFDSMVATRSQLRDKRIQETVFAIEAQKAELWIAQEQSISSRVEQEIKSNNVNFFMDEEQREYQTIIEGMVVNLEALPEGDKKTVYAKKIGRIKAYFSWWVDDSYIVNRWAVQKQLRGLSREVKNFKQHHSKLMQQINSDAVNERLAERIENGRNQLSILKVELEKNLENARANLVLLVKEELDRQSSETQGYLLAAREAQARLADALYLTQPPEISSVKEEQ